MAPEQDFYTEWIIFPSIEAELFEYSSQCSTKHFPVWLVGTGINSEFLWVPVTVSHSFHVFLFPDSNSFLIYIHWPIHIRMNTWRGPSASLCSSPFVQLSPLWSSALWHQLPWSFCTFSSFSATLGVWSPLCGLPFPMLCPGNFLKAVGWAIKGVTSFVSHV